MFRYTTTILTAASLLIFCSRQLCAMESGEINEDYDKSKKIVAVAAPKNQGLIFQSGFSKENLQLFFVAASTAGADPRYFVQVCKYWKYAMEYEGIPLTIDKAGILYRTRKGDYLFEDCMRRYRENIVYKASLSFKQRKNDKEQTSINFSDYKDDATGLFYYEDKENKLVYTNSPTRFHELEKTDNLFSHPKLITYIAPLHKVQDLLPTGSATSHVVLLWRLNRVKHIEHFEFLSGLTLNELSTVSMLEIYKKSLRFPAHDREYFLKIKSYDTHLDFSRLSFAHAMKEEETRKEVSATSLFFPNELLHNIFSLTLQDVPRFLKTLLCVSSHWYASLIGKSIQDDQVLYKVLSAFNQWVSSLTTNRPPLLYKPTFSVDFRLCANRPLTRQILQNWSKANIIAIHLIDNAEIMDQDIQHFTNLTDLSLSSNTKIKGDGIKNLTNLTDLDLSDNKIIKGDDIKNFTNLKLLNLFKQSHIMNDCIENFTLLTALGLGKNKLITGDGIKSLPNLTQLDLQSNNKIRGADIENLSALKILNLNKNYEITDESLKKLTNLTKLSLRKNPIITDESIKNLSNLTNLNLCENKCITGKSVKNLIALKVLDLASNNKITDKDIIDHTNLTTLNLTNNGTITFESVSNLTNLRNFFSIETSLKENIKYSFYLERYILPWQSSISFQHYLKNLNDLLKLKEVKTDLNMSFLVNAK